MSYEPPLRDAGMAPPANPIRLSAERREELYPMWIARPEPRKSYAAMIREICAANREAAALSDDPNKFDGSFLAGFVAVICFAVLLLGFAIMMPSDGALAAFYSWGSH